SKAREDIRPAQCRHGVAARDPNLPVVKRGLQVNDTVVVNVSQLHALRLSQAWPESQAPLINRLAREGYVAYQIDRQEPIVADIDHGVRRVLLQRRDRRQRSQDGVGEHRGVTTRVGIPRTSAGGGVIPTRDRHQIVYLAEHDREHGPQRLPGPAAFAETLTIAWGLTRARGWD